MRRKIQRIRELQNEKMARGLKKYGRFDPANDARDFRREILSELVDALNYMEMARAAGQRVPLSSAVKFALIMIAIILLKGE